MNDPCMYLDFSKQLNSMFVERWILHFSGGKPRWRSNLFLQLL